MARQVFYTETANRHMAALLPNDDEFESVTKEVKELAKKPDLGYRIPFWFSDPDLFRVNIGRFGLIYAFDEDELNIVDVIS
jgi:mRNA-degrading endonuclease RelE of RelBE toxin-antitoxin system